MKKQLKRILCLLLTVCMLFSLVTEALAATVNAPEDAAQTGFDFSASDYSVTEGDTLSITVKRNDSADKAAIVFFKAADLMSEYGRDYVLLDDEGRELARVEGNKPSISELMSDDGSLYGESLESIPQAGGAAGSSALFNAAGEYLGLDADAGETKNELGEAISSLGDYFAEAQGAEGQLFFEKGEKEQRITVKTLDNSVYDGTRLFMLAITGVADRNGDSMVAPNATCYVNLIDDESSDVRYSIVNDGTVLSAENPSAEVRIVRLSGTQSFSTVYVSTVRNTAPEGSYDAFHDTALDFAPGETEKTVTVTAYDFSVGGSFYLRLEAADADFGTYLTSVSIERDGGIFKGLLAASDSGTLGKKYSTPDGGKHDSIPNGNDRNSVNGQAWDPILLGNGMTVYFGRSGSTPQNSRWGYYASMNSYGNAGLTSKWDINFAGIRRVIVDGGSLNNSTWGLDVSTSRLSKNSFHSGYKFSTSSPAASSSSVFTESGLVTSAAFATNLGCGYPNYSGESTQKTIYTKHYELNVAGFNDFAYLNFWEYGAYGIYLYGVSMEHTLYNFRPQATDDSFTRLLYDYSEKTYWQEGFKMRTFFDGEKELAYTPGSVKVVYNGNPVNSFYSNAGVTAQVVPVDPDDIAAKGLRLKGVYFANKSVTVGSIPDSSGAGSKVSKALYLAAEDGVVNIALDGSFIKLLISEGVLSPTNPETEDIKIFPVYEQEMVTVVFTPAESEENYLWNVEESWIAAGSQTSENGDKPYILRNFRGTGLTAYAIVVPKQTILRLRGVVGAGKSIEGIYAETRYGSPIDVFFHAADTYIYSSVDPNGIYVRETDFSLADIPADDMIVCPNIADQTVYIGYFGRYDEATGKMDNSSRPADIASRVGCFTTGEACDENGAIEIKVLNGQSYSFVIQPPEGYYVKWTNMSGDLDRNGNIDGQKENSIQQDRYRSVNPVYVYGSRLNLTVDKDKTQYYYSFEPIPSDPATVTKTGFIKRENNTFYRLTQNLPVMGDPVPCAGDTVTIADWTAKTDKNGKYTVNVGALGRSGDMSASAIVEGMTYYFTAPIETVNETYTVPALSTFTAKSLSARYDKTAYAKSAGGNAIIVEDDTLTISAEVLSCGNIRPADAKFRIFRGNTLVNEFDSSGGAVGVTFTQTTTGGIAKLMFNPKAYLQTGDKLYVAFADEGGQWTPYIDTGYNFASPVTLTEFLLPIFGESMLTDDPLDPDFDLIGSLLSNISLGSITDLGSGEIRTVSPANISDAEKASGLYDWTETEYRAGLEKSMIPHFDKNTSSSGGSSAPAGGAEHEFTEAEMAAGVKALQDAESISDLKKPAGSKYSTTKAYLWNLDIGVGFRLVLSQRTDASGNAQTYFEDVSFYFKAKSVTNTSITVALPIGVTIAFKFDLELSAVGIYHLYNNYSSDDRHITGLIPYDDFRINTNDPKVSRDGYIFLDPVIKAHLEVGLGIITVGGGATFIMDMDFHFKGSGTDTYGGADVNLDWYIKLLGFKVYSKDYDVTEFKMFGGEPINYDSGQNDKALKAALQTAFSAEGGVTSFDTPTDRDYLDKRSGWLGGNRLFAGGANSKAVTEKTLMNGTATEPYMSLTELGDGKMLMVFIGDDASRTSVNKRALYFSVSADGGTTWAEPQQVDNDGTLDDYPDAFPLGDGRVLVSWSSVDTVLPEGATVEDALRSLNIKCAFFDADTLTFGEVTQLTKTTDEDICADTQPHAAYDEGTGRLILYYTKTEYKDLTELGDIGAAESLTAYLFFENGQWQNTGDAYSDKEIAAAPDPAAYREQWYGQRFLDPRIELFNDNMPLIISSDAVCYNHLAYYTWVADWDNDRDTVGDRDVFVQIYNFKEASFTHIIRITRESGCYTLPTLQRTDDGTFLFFGETNDDGSVIKQLDIGNAVADRHYTICTAENTKFYELYTVDENGNELWLYPEAVTECGNIEDYSSACDENGNLYLFWTESDDAGRQVCAAMSTDGRWSQPFTMTEGENEFYNGISAAVLGGKIFVGGGKGNYSDSSDTALVMLTHVPYARLVPEGISVSDEHPNAGGNVAVTVTVKNTGLLPLEGSHEISLSLNGEAVGSTSFDGTLGGGETAEITFSAVIPNEFDKLDFVASCDGKLAGAVFDKAAELSVVSSGIVAEKAPDGSDELYYILTLENTGNESAPAEAELTLGGRVVAGGRLPQLQPGDVSEMKIELMLPDSAFTIPAGSGTGHAELNIELRSGTETVWSGTETASRSFDADAAALLPQLGSIEAAFTMEPGEALLLQPELPEGLRVLWLASGDDKVVQTDARGRVYAVGEGETTLTGTVVSAKAYPDEHWEVLAVPSYMQRTVTATVKVGTPEPPTGHFTDVPETHNFYPAIEWAVENAIASGYDDGSFRPGEKCTRAQVVTFLWRAAGRPEPATTGNPFSDVSESSAFYKAILWANENGIAAGYSDGSFRPNASVTRAQFVTFLWRASGRPELSEPVQSFSDDAEIAAGFKAAVNWAVGSGITVGYSDGTFRPNATCTRGAVAQFMYKAMHE